ncbi:helix-turn-helix domain-containing protein [Enterococcus faecalis]|uniref:helix-turn-helix domain-containing protein n=1 Tax=Enterococcus faecalis TaxID=1351 RepID=UPI000330874F|nr:helix-turn-helix domain-containing protein [Enterococcus faecalis]EHQ8829089.1 helix-turn-helix domain-containing protein [Enterococcus faecalis]EOJ96020.1 hypothetical protein WOQ_02702 [Enterococcus faecalis EnGen0340]MBM9831843.1 helix-turn-helix domain-containing protein [Enterococcus faecalis]MCO5440295.1 helix-turn-helix domain-containing protein [Enterococcus faecalis]
MNQLIYERSLRMKVEIVKKILENNKGIDKSRLCDLLPISPTTIDKYISEMYLELPQGSIMMRDGNFEIDSKIISFYDIQMFYLSNSVIQNVLAIIFFEKKVTFEMLAQRLYISSSKLFTVVKFLKKKLGELGIQVITSPYVSIKGSRESILVLYNTFLQTLTNPYEQSFSKYNEMLLKRTIESFFNFFNIKISRRLVREMSLWVVSLSDLSYMKSFLSEDAVFDDVFFEWISFDSPIIQKMKCDFNKLLSVNTFNEKMCVILLTTLIFNTSDLHFNNYESEHSFYCKKMYIDFHYKSVIFELLMKEEVDPIDVNILSVKLEICLHFISLLSPYYYLNRSFFNSVDSKYSHKLMLDVRKEFLYLEKEILFEESSELKTTIYDFLSYIVVSCQKVNIKNPLVTFTIRSSKGSIFEKNFCEEFEKSIRVVPYYEIEESGKFDILIVDDLRLLDNCYNYNNYLLVENLDKLLGGKIVKSITKDIEYK